MFGSSVSGVLSTLQQLVASLDADVLDPAEAEQLVGEFARIEHVAAAGKALAAGRVATSGRWSRSGERSEADWLAKQTGVPVGAAREVLEVARNVRDCEATDTAFRSGELSVVQAAAVASAVAVAPSAERELLALAKGVAVGKLRDEAARVRAAALPDAEARRAAIHRSRSLATWTSADGARCGRWRMTPEASAEVETVLRRYADTAYRAARAEGRAESSEAYAADGLVAMARAAASDDAPAPAGTRPEMILLVNLESLHRGEVADGETCEIAGVGPVAVSVAEELLGESLLELVIRDDVDIRTVVHLGRQPTAAQRTALLVRQRGRCARPTCARPVQQIDHTHDWATTKQTTLDSLAGLCTPDHQLKTHHGHTYRQGQQGWEWTRPDGTIEHERPPP